MVARRKLKLRSWELERLGSPWPSVSLIALAALP